MGGQEKICRLCLTNCGNIYKTVQENVKKTLNLSPESNLFISEDAVMCKNCSESINDCSNFKTMCLDVDVFIVKLSHKKNNVKLNLKEANNIPEGYDICRLCMGSLRVCSFTSLDSKVENFMLSKCLPELDLLVTEKPVICETCRETLKHYFHFLTKCFIAEQKIKKYREASGIDAPCLIRLKNVLEFTTKKTSGKIGRIKMEDKLYGTDNEQCTSENISTNKDVQIKIEEIDMEIELKLEHSGEIEDRQVNNGPEFAIRRYKIGDQVDLIKMLRGEKRPRERRTRSKVDGDYVSPNSKNVLLRQKIITYNPKLEEDRGVGVEVKQTVEPRERQLKRTRSASERRGLNNVAARKLRLKQKIAKLKFEKEADEILSRNIKLKLQVVELERMVNYFRDNLSDVMIKK